ncbi:MAG: ATP-binding protein, partial [Thermomicrobiales bacterium]
YQIVRDDGDFASHHEASPDAIHAGLSFLRSLRFRLTAWYALILILILVTLGISLRTILVRSLDNDMNQRLLAAAQLIESQTWTDDRPQAIAATRDIRPSSRLRPPSFEPLILSGMWAAMIDWTVGGFLPNPTIPDPDNTLQSLDRSGEFVLNQSEVQTISVLGTKTRVLIAPFDPFQTGTVSAWVVVGQSAESLVKTVSLLNQVLVLVGAIGVVLAAGTGWMIAGRALSPVGRITRTADQIAQDQNDVSLSKRLAVSRAGDELSQLAMTFNAMLDRLESAFDTQRRFVADASHELRTPLTAMRGNVDVLLRQIKAGKVISPEELRESLGDVQHESERMGRLIDDLLTLARTDASGLGSLVNLQPISLDVLAREAFRTGQALARGQQMTLDIRESIMVEGDGDRLVQVIIILLENALRHTPVDGTISLTIDSIAATADDPRCARIIVQDSGEGISAEHLPHLFERFYRVEGARTRSHGGTGLGLAIALSIVRGHHGWIDVESGSEGDGTTFIIYIPVPVVEGEVLEIEASNPFTSRIPRLGRARKHEPASPPPLPSIREE